MNKLFKVAVVLGAFGLFAPTPVRAEWVYMGEGARGDFLYVDNQTIRQVGADTVSFWQNTKYRYVKNGLAGIKRHQVLNCTQGLWATDYKMMYDSYGNIIDSYEVPETEIEVNRVTPNTLGADIQDYVCR
jgi:hypothetical protein